MSALAAAAARLRQVLGPGAVHDDPYETALLGYDAGLDESPPVLAVLPASTAEVVEVVRTAGELDLPVVARGGGTGLSGGATCPRGGIAVLMARMNRILSIEASTRTAVVQAGVPNLELSRQSASLGLHFAPDPSSQKASTIGGNIAENAGGPHTLRYGVTAGHVLAAEVVLHDATVRWLEAPTGPGGYDLLGVLVGSEGTLGLVTTARVRLTPLPEAVVTLLAAFPSVRAAGEAVTRIVAAGIVPAALEMMDRLTLRAIEAYARADYPTEAQAVLLAEVDGLAEEVDEAAAQVERICREAGACTLRRARDQRDRDRLWKGRKEAGGALGRLARHFYVMDGVVPVSEVPRLLASIDEIAERHGLPVGTLVHAGDGNVHPNVLFNDRHEIERVLACADDIERACLKLGGSLSGEHGVGAEKLHLMREMFSEVDLDTMRAVRKAFDPGERLNPGKVLPPPAGTPLPPRPAVLPGVGRWI